MAVSFPSRRIQRMAERDYYQMRAQEVLDAPNQHISWRSWETPGIFPLTRGDFCYY